MNLNEAIDYIYLEEDLKSFTKEKIQKVLSLLKNKNEESIVKISHLVPNISLETIEKLISKKVKSFKIYFEQEKKLVKNDAGAMITACLLCLKEETKDDKKLKILENTIEVLRKVFLTSGKLYIALFVIGILFERGILVMPNTAIDLLFTQIFIGSLFTTIVTGILLTIAYLVHMHLEKKEENNDQI
jgi:hypothetical protein